MRAIVASLPKSGTRLIRSLLDSHPAIDCRFDDDSGDVGVFHFYNLRWEWLTDPAIKVILLSRDYFDGAVSEMVSPHGQRANYQYQLNPGSINRVMRRRRLQTNLLRPYADVEMTFEELTGGVEVVSTELPQVCNLLGIEQRVLISDMKPMPKMVPGNLEELRARAVH